MYKWTCTVQTHVVERSAASGHLSMQGFKYKSTESGFYGSDFWSLLSLPWPNPVFLCFCFYLLSQFSLLHQALCFPDPYFFWISPRCSRTNCRSFWDPHPPHLSIDLFCKYGQLSIWALPLSPVKPFLWCLRNMSTRGSWARTQPPVQAPKAKCPSGQLVFLAPVSGGVLVFLTQAFLTSWEFLISNPRECPLMAFVGNQTVNSLKPSIREEHCACVKLLRCRKYCVCVYMCVPTRGDG